MCLVPELFHFVSLHSFLYSDYEYFAWYVQESPSLERADPSDW